MSKGRILVVDDDAGVRELIGKIVELHGYTHVEAAGVPRAVEVWKEEAPVLTITDVDLLVGTGFELCQELRLLDPEHPMVVMSGSEENLESDELAVICAAHAGVTKVVPKPFPIAKFLSAVLDALGTPDGHARLESRAENAETPA